MCLLQPFFAIRSRPWRQLTLGPYCFSPRAPSRLPSDVYRCKGVIHSAEHPDRRAILQVVGKRVDVSLGGAWGQGRPRTRIVAIGAPGAFAGETLREGFDRCNGDAGGTSSGLVRP